MQQGVGFIGPASRNVGKRSASDKKRDLRAIHRADTTREVVKSTFLPRELKRQRDDGGGNRAVAPSFHRAHDDRESQQLLHVLLREVVKTMCIDVAEVARTEAASAAAARAKAAYVKSRSAEQGAVEPIVIGNEERWRTFRAWLRESRVAHKPSVMLLLGPQGCGKTMGIHAEARRVCVEVNEVFGADLVTPTGLLRDLRMSCTRAHVQEVSRPLTVLDDVDALPSEISQGLLSFLQSRGEECGPLVIAGTQPLSYHLRSLRDQCKVLYMEALRKPQISKVVLQQVPGIRPGDADALARGCHGDARQAVLQARVLCDGAPVISSCKEPRTVCANPFETARKMLFSVSSVEEATRVSEANDVSPLLIGLLHENYTDALSASVSISVEQVFAQSESFSMADTWRCGPARVLTEPAQCVLATCGLGSGATKRGDTRNLRLRMPRAAAHHAPAFDADMPAALNA